MKGGRDPRSRSLPERAASEKVGQTRRQQRIYVDMDDVLCETAQGFLRLLNAAYERDVRFEQIVSFDLGRSFKLDRAEIERFMQEAHREDVLIDLEPIAGALEAVTGWVRDGYIIEIVTGRPPSTEPVSRAWLDRHRVPYESLTFVAKYSHLHSDEDIGRARKLSDLSGDDYCLAVEDSFDMACFLGDLGLDVALLDRPWNRDGDRPLPEGVVRCRGWQALKARFPAP